MKFFLQKIFQWKFKLSQKEKYSPLTLWINQNKNPNVSTRECLKEMIDNSIFYKLKIKANVSASYNKENDDIVLV